MQIVFLSKAEFDQHINESVHTYAYYRIAQATLEVVSTARGVVKASFIAQLPLGSVYGAEDELDTLTLVCTATPFQIKVWQAVRTIPSGMVVTYADIAQRIGNAHAYRAVGTALSRNRIAYLIPCHRVINKNGDIKRYRWGSTIKGMVLEWEKGIKR